MSTVCARPALSESAYQPMWNTVLSAADTPAVQWADGCDFIGSNAIGFQPGSWAAGCMILCENDPQCTHVSADGTTCHFMSNPNGVVVVPSKTVKLCGFIVGRSRQD